MNLELHGCIVTIDAMGCQKGIAKEITNKDASYVLALKGNHGDLYKDVKLFFEDVLKNGFQDFSFDYFESIEKDHGRIETWRYRTVSDIDRLFGKEVMGEIETHWQ